MKTTKKLTLSALMLALALVLPFFTGQIPEIGNMLLPMHLQDIGPTLLLSLVMFGVVFPISFLDINIWLALAIQVVLGAIIYISISAIFKVESFKYILSLVKGILKRGKKK